jgi:lipopolysaccharide biosynthesis glycosyltransferase
MKKAIVSAAFGEFYDRMAQLTYPSFRKYANKVGADFIALRDRKFTHLTSHLEKFQLYDVLGEYDVAVWIDCDALVSYHACSIFDAVPPGHFAAVDEGKVGVIFDIEAELKSMAEPLGLGVPADRPFVYFNSGVFVVYKEHRDIFDIPQKQPPTKHGLPEQTLLNLRVAQRRIPFYSLPKTWNSIWCTVGYEHDHIVHFAGRQKDEKLLETIRGMERFL